MSKKDMISGKKNLLIPTSGYYKSYIADISVCGYEKILVAGYEAEKLVKHLHKKCLTGKITLSGLSDEETKAASKKYVLKKRIDVSSESMKAMLNSGRIFDIIILHLNYNDLDIEPDLKILRQLLNHTGTLFVRERTLSFDLEDMEAAVENEDLSLIKSLQTNTNLFGDVYDLKIRHK
ncbi:hypothetical protein ACE01N_02215 [Saccharicrinis sp. FJH2]|uniref:hypothetical protein n=1 Tax=Saccharicrinis sp. FJH65 TaxID=3344659 RepID=UPI0035F4927F